MIRNLIDNVFGKHAYHVEIVKIIEEEAESYFQGRKTAEQVAEIIQPLVGVIILVKPSPNWKATTVD